MASPLVAPPVAKAKALFCPNCGGPVERRGFGHTLTVVCPQCLSVLDASTPLFTVLQKIEEAQRRTPLIPLGQRGKLAGAAWETIGFQTRGVEEDGVLYEWEEYLLFNPYKGFRYLTNYQGHWNYVTPLEPMPSRIAVGGRPAVKFEGRTFKHFSGAEATTTFVLGEFPWRVIVGEKVVADDFVDPPTVLSSETTEDEVTWSRGEYTPGMDIWKAFALQNNPPRPQGTYLNQPSPFQGKVGGIWSTFGLMLVLLIMLAIFFATFSAKDVAFHDRYHFSTADKGEPSFVTKPFDLKGRTTSLELEITTNLLNNWAYFNFALINEDTGEAYDFGREVSYYAGSDSDGGWSEGSASTSVMIPAVPPGKYYLRVEPEMDTSTANTTLRTANRAVPANTMYYEITLVHDVPNYSWFWIAALMLLIPPIFYSIRARSFDVRRWMQSDYPPVTTSS